MNATLLDRSELPNGFAGVDELEAFMARPSRVGSRICGRLSADEAETAIDRDMVLIAK